MTELEAYFKGLSDSSRLRIMNLLLHGELCGCDIQYVLAAPQPNVSRHLTYLKNAGLVVDRRDGFRIFYRLAEPRKGIRKQLFEFLRNAFKGKEALQRDVDRLRQAIKGGACTVEEWQPYSALTRIKTSATLHAQGR
jgi:ArsR family transcriptional regulator